MRFAEYAQYDAVGLADLVRHREVSPAELLEVARVRAEAVNPRINAVVTTTEAVAERQIASASRKAPLYGVPFLLKDLGTPLAGERLSNGSRVLADYRPDEDSWLVERYKRAGLVIFGKTNTPEFGASATTEPVLFGPCRNPWNPSHSAGGSSGGSAAAVAAGIVPAAHGSDGGGSIRIPASSCGLFGLKPSRGRVTLGPTDGPGLLANVCHHVISRTVRDSAALLDAVAGPGPGDPYWAPPPERPFAEEVNRPPQRLRIAYTSTTYEGTRVHPDCATAVDEAAKLCERLGHVVFEKSLAFDSALFFEAFNVLAGARMFLDLELIGKIYGRRIGDDEIEPITRVVVDLGRRASGLQLASAARHLDLLRRDVADFFADIDVFLSPVLAQPPIRLGVLSPTTTDLDSYSRHFYSYVTFTPIFNATGQPSMSVPLSWNGNGLPVGVHFASRLYEEGLLFRLAAQLEQASPWHDRRPSLH